MKKELIDKIAQAENQYQVNLKAGHAPKNKPVPNFNQILLVSKEQSYMLQTSQFCALGREKKWIDWLSIVDKELASIMSEAAIKTSCRESRHTMERMLNELRIRGYTNDLITFLSKEYPMIIYKV